MIVNNIKKDIEIILRGAGQTLRSFLYTDITTCRKADGGLVTRADVEVESFLIEELQKIIPGSAIWAEESGKSGNSEYCWVIDPLDGTSNFARGLPYFCISIALMKNQKTIMGAIYQPVSDELFFAAEGQSAFCNGVSIHPSAKNSLSGAMVVFSQIVQLHV